VALSTNTRMQQQEAALATECQAEEEFWSQVRETGRSVRHGELVIRFRDGEATQVTVLHSQQYKRWRRTTSQAT
jgi:hypothetical protein